MKINKLILIFAVGLLLFSSCEDDLLDYEPFGETAENYFQDAEDYENALIGVYDQLSMIYMTYMVGEIASDNAFCGGESASDVLGWQTIDDMTQDPENDQLLDYWRRMYGGVSRANFLLDNKDNIGDFEGKAQIVAEAQFLRTYYYFELAKFFGNIPYSETLVSVDNIGSVEQVAQSEVYANLAATLEEAIPNLPWTASQPGRVTRGAAYALLGKIYLYNEDYTNAATALDNVINSGQYQLLSDYSQLFTLENENNEESVFEVQYIGTQGGGFGCFSCLEGNIVPGFIGPRFRTGDFSPYTDGWSFSPMTEDLVNSYATEDVRKVNTIFDIEAFITAHPDVTYTEGYENTGYFNQKYMPYAEGNAPATNLTHSNNYRAIRYSDVLLMAAEAYNRGGLGDVMALTYLNQVRERAGLADATETGSTLTQKIWDERRLELAGEGQRFFDQVRTGETSTIPGFTTGKNEVFPIPAVEIRLSEGRWTQNAGY